MDYLRDPAAIYRESFAAIRAEADLAHLPVALHPAAVRMIHACGMVDLACDVMGDPAMVGAVEHSLGKGSGLSRYCSFCISAVGVMSKPLALQHTIENWPTAAMRPTRSSVPKSRSASSTGTT